MVRSNNTGTNVGHTDMCEHVGLCRFVAILSGVILYPPVCPIKVTQTNNAIFLSLIIASCQCKLTSDHSRVCGSPIKYSSMNINPGPLVGLSQVMTLNISENERNC